MTDWRTLHPFALGDWVVLAGGGDPRAFRVRMTGCDDAGLWFAAEGLKERFSAADFTRLDINHACPACGRAIPHSSHEGQLTGADAAADAPVSFGAVEEAAAAGLVHAASEPELKSA